MGYKSGILSTEIEYRGRSSGESGRERLARQQNQAAGHHGLREDKDVGQEVEGKLAACCCAIKVKTEASALTKVEVTGDLKSYCSSSRVRTDASWRRLEREPDAAVPVKSFEEFGCKGQRRKESAKRDKGHLKKT